MLEFFQTTWVSKSHDKLKMAKTVQTIVNANDQPVGWSPVSIARRNHNDLEADTNPFSLSPFLTTYIYVCNFCSGRSLMEQETTGR